MNDNDAPVTREEVRREMQRFGEQLLVELVKAMTGQPVSLDNDRDTAGERLRKGGTRAVGFVQFTKFNEATGEFVGLMTSETPDDDREIMDFDKSRVYIEGWSAGAFQRSGGKSYGNVREMHGLNAAGKLTEPLQFDAVSKRVLVRGLIVDPVARRKAAEGVYSGLSIGGRYVNRWPDPDRPGFTRYVADPTEVSLVDSPNNPDAVMELIGPTGSSKVIKIGRAAAAKDVSRDEICELQKAARAGDPQARECLARLERDGVRSSLQQPRYDFPGVR